MCTGPLYVVVQFERYAQIKWLKNKKVGEENVKNITLFFETEAVFFVLWSIEVVMRSNVSDQAFDILILAFTMFFFLRRFP